VRISIAMNTLSSSKSSGAKRPGSVRNLGDVSREAYMTRMKQFAMPLVAVVVVGLAVGVRSAGAQTHEAKGASSPCRTRHRRSSRAAT
jgi:hypothetical protein